MFACNMGMYLWGQCPMNQTSIYRKGIAKRAISEPKTKESSVFVLKFGGEKETACDQLWKQVNLHWKHYWSIFTQAVSSGSCIDSW